jgi:hypothetical protein
MGRELNKHKGIKIPTSFLILFSPFSAIHNTQKLHYKRTANDEQISYHEK